RRGQGVAGSRTADLAWSFPFAFATLQSACWRHPMSFSFCDVNAPRFRGPASELPRGLVLPPPELRDRVAQDQARGLPGFTDVYAKLILDDWTLAYYYEGTHVAYRSVEQGVEVLAV